MSDVSVRGIRDIVADVMLGWDVGDKEAADELARLVLDVASGLLSTDKAWHQKHKHLCDKGDAWHEGFIAGIDHAARALRTAE